MIQVGTSGYSYADWVGHFYPTGTPKTGFLAYYAKHFSACEINYTYYRPPDARTLLRMVEKSGASVEFVIKANKEMTHTRNAGEADYKAFAQALTPLHESGTFGCILAQFPYAFRPSKNSLQYLQTLRQRFGELPVVAEFRHTDWVREECFDFLKENSIGFCCVDEPPLKGLMPPVARITSDIGYIRFHGRNAAKWWKHERPEERYDYLYQAEELAPWIPKIKEVEAETKKTFVFTNNHFESKAVQNAKMLLNLLKEPSGS